MRRVHTVIMAAVAVLTVGCSSTTVVGDPTAASGDPDAGRLESALLATGETLQLFIPGGMVLSRSELDEPAGDIPELASYIIAPEQPAEDGIDRRVIVTLGRAENCSSARGISDSSAHAGVDEPRPLPGGFGLDPQIRSPEITADKKYAATIFVTTARLEGGMCSPVLISWGDSVDDLQAIRAVKADMEPIMEQIARNSRDFGEALDGQPTPSSAASEHAEFSPNTAGGGVAFTDASGKIACQVGGEMSGSYGANNTPGRQIEAMCVVMPPDYVGPTIKRPSTCGSGPAWFPGAAAVANDGTVVGGLCTGGQPFGLTGGAKPVIVSAGQSVSVDDVVCAIREDVTCVKSRTGSGFTLAVDDLEIFHDG